MTSDIQPLFMRRALELAEKGKGRTRSNPMVGAVLVHDGRIIGEGWHAAYGGPHAEVACLEDVAAEDRHLIPFATMYVTLEPCAHHGKTPPCADRIITEGIKKVVIAQRDPFPQVDGKGLDKLRGAGIDTSVGVCEAEARWQTRRFLSAHTRQRPYIILKWAQSADGMLAPADRTRTQLSGPLSQRLVHRWRGEESAILVGYRTALHDNPALTARFGASPHPLRILLDRDLSLPPDAAIYADDAQTWVLHRAGDGPESGGHVRFIQTEKTSELAVLMQELQAVARHSLIVEGGAAVIARFQQEGLWDEARIFHAPTSLMNGLPAPVLSGSQTCETLSIGTDTLEIRTAADNPFTFCPGMAL